MKRHRGLPDITVCNTTYCLVHTDTMKQGAETFKCSQNWLQEGQLQYQLSGGTFINFQGTKTLKLQHPSTLQYCALTCFLSASMSYYNPAQLLKLLYAQEHLPQTGN